MEIGFYYFMFPWVTFIIGLVLYNIITKLLRRKRILNSGILQIDKMSGREFEIFLKLKFKQLGYKVIATRYRGDYGADLIIIDKKAKERIIVQAKRYSNVVGISAVQEAVAAIAFYDCHRCMVVTNSRFSSQAKELAEANTKRNCCTNVEMWDRNILIEKLNLANETEITPDMLDDLEVAEEEEVPENFTAIIDNPDYCCVCGTQVSQKVKEFCLGNGERFEGKVYCFEHQNLKP